MDHSHVVIPELDWLATSCEVDDSWLGPGPQLVNIQPWMERLVDAGHHTLVRATYAAAQAACQHWDKWMIASLDTVSDSILTQEPLEQLAAVARWLDSPTIEQKALALKTVDHTKQLHWFHEEYDDVWFDQPGMWAIESSEYCVLSLTGDPYSPDSLAELATTAIVCAVNSFRASARDDIRVSLSIVIDAIRRQFRQRE